MAEEKKPSVIELALSAGKIVMLTEYLGSKPDTIKYIAKKGPNAGKEAHFNRVTHSCLNVDSEGVAETVKVNTRVPDDVDPKTVPAPAKRGQRVLVIVDSVEMDNGNRTISASSIIALG